MFEGEHQGCLLVDRRKPDAPIVAFLRALGLVKRKRRLSPRARARERATWIRRDKFFASPNGIAQRVELELLRSIA